MQNHEEIKYIPITGGIIPPKMKGGAEKEANNLREKILNCKDNLNIVGTVYYVSDNGDDENDGLSPDSPIKSFDKLDSIDLKPGDGVLFERGSIFRLQYYYVCRERVVYGAYGEGEKPRIYGSSKNYADEKFWQPSEYENLWKCELEYIDPIYADAGLIVFNYDKEVGIKQRDIRALSGNGYFYFDMDTQSVYLYSDKGNPGRIYNDIEIGRRCGILKLMPGVIVDNLCLRYTGGHCICGIGPKKYDITVTNCEMGWIGGSTHGPNNRYGNAFECYNGCENIRVENCYIYQVFDAGVTFQGDIETSEYKNIKFLGNLLEYCSWSIEWWSGWEKSIYNDQICDIGVIDDVLFDSNIMRFDGFGWSGITRSPCHIHGPWGTRTYKNFSDFRITNNIFDCANGEIMRWDQGQPPIPKQEGLFIGGNSYYRISTKENRAFRMGTVGITYANNKEELKSEVANIDPTYKVVEWIEK